MRSERILEIAMVLMKEEEVFSDKEKFTIWMKSKILALGGIKPEELFESSYGIKILNDELIAIAYGIFA